MDFLAAAAVGSVLGLATGMIPGLHVNTLAALAFLDGMAVVLLAAGTVHTIVNIVPSTYLGAPDDDVLSLLPAHRLMLAGDGRSAVHASVVGSLLAVLGAVALMPIYTAALHRGFMAWTHAMAVPLLVGVVLLLLAQERRRIWAAMILGTTGIFGVLCARLPGPDGFHLLPMLGGLFGAAGMLVALRRPPPVPPQSPPSPATPPWRATGASLVAAGFTAVLPGVSASVAAATLRAEATPRRAVSVLSSINTAHAIFAIAVVMAVGRVRTGLADAVQTGRPLAIWSPSGPATGALEIGMVILFAGVMGGAGTLALDRIISARVHQIPARLLPAIGLACITAITAIITGWLGLAILATGATLGLVPLAAGIRRVHLVGCLIGPALLSRWP